MLCAQKAFGWKKFSEENIWHCRLRCFFNNMDQVPICGYSTENNRKSILIFLLGFFCYIWVAELLYAKVLRITWGHIAPVWVCKLSFILCFQPKLWGSQRRWRFPTLYLNQTPSTWASKVCPKESPSGVPPGLEFHASKGLSVGAEKSNLLLKSMFVIQFFFFYSWFWSYLIFFPAALGFQCYLNLLPVKQNILLLCFTS